LRHSFGGPSRLDDRTDALAAIESAAVESSSSRVVEILPNASAVERPAPEGSIESVWPEDVFDREYPSRDLPQRFSQAPTAMTPTRSDLAIAERQALVDQVQGFRRLISVQNRTVIAALTELDIDRRRAKAAEAKWDSTVESYAHARQAGETAEERQTAINLSIENMTFQSVKLCGEADVAKARFDRDRALYEAANSMSEALLRISDQGLREAVETTSGLEKKTYAEIIRANASVRAAERLVVIKREQLQKDVRMLNLLNNPLKGLRALGAVASNTTYLEATGESLTPLEVNIVEIVRRQSKAVQNSTDELTAAQVALDDASTAREQAYGAHVRARSAADASREKLRKQREATNAALETKEERRITMHESRLRWAGLRRDCNRLTEQREELDVATLALNETRSAADHQHDVAEAEIRKLHAYQRDLAYAKKQLRAFNEQAAIAPSQTPPTPLPPPLRPVVVAAPARRQADPRKWAQEKSEDVKSRFEGAIDEVRDGAKGKVDVRTWAQEKSEDAKDRVKDTVDWVVDAKEGANELNERTEDLRELDRSTTAVPDVRVVGPRECGNAIPVLFAVLVCFVGLACFAVYLARGKL